jgi:tetratricopeptide (TPR) repeat protein
MDDTEDELELHLDRLMESAYEALASSHGIGSPQPLPEPERPERIGPYPVTGLLGRGGTSIVWKGHDPDLDREIAIKVIDPRHALDTPLAKRFLDEARLCSRLAHPGIVPIYGMGQLADGRPWFTMRLVEGETLASLLHARTSPAERQQQLLEIFARTCETVAFAHARGVVHGDLKPGNVMVGSHGQVQVVDWGFSRLLDEPAVLRRGIGTPAFMAPEQAARGAETIDTRTDVFGLGAILCVILTGEPPFVGGSRSEVHVRAANGDLAGARDRLHACGADAGLVRLALDCMAAHPTDRPASAAVVQERLSAWFLSVEQRARRLQIEAAEAQVATREQRRTRTRTWVLAMLAVVFAGVYAWMQFEQQARDFETRTAVAQAIERARSRRAGADVAGAERIRWLGEAALAAQQARTFAATHADADLLAEAEDLVRRYEAERDSAIGDASMMAWLDDFPSHLDLTRDQLDARYEQGFRDYGLDVQALGDDEVVQTARGRPIAAALARALDDWGFVRRLAPKVPAAEWQRFHRLAMAIDDDPNRTAVRRALLDDDRAALVRLADDPVLADAGSDTLDLLANGLDRAGQRHAAIAVWQRANARHPDDVRVIHSLAVHHFSEPGCPPWTEMVRLFTAGTALRPQSAHLWTDLAAALLGAGDVAGADAALQRALAIDPRDGRAHATMIDLTICRCRPAEAIARSRDVAERADDANAWRVHGDACLQAGRVDHAVDAFRRAAAREGTAAHHERLAKALLARNDAAAAAHACDVAIAVDGKHAGAHLQRGLALRASGSFERAMQAFDIARELGDAQLAVRCEALLDETERAVAHAERLAADRDVEAGLAEVAATAHLLGDAQVATDLYRAAFAAVPATADQTFLGWHLDHAARAAAAAGANDDATTWLRAAIEKLAQALAGGTATPAFVRQQIAAWRHGPTLAPMLSALRPDLDLLMTRIDANVPAVRVHSPFDRWYAFHELGQPPGVLAPYGGLLIEADDPDVLVVAGHAQRRSASLEAVTLRRDVSGHIDGFRGDVRRLAAAPFADGGIVRGPRRMLLYTRYPNAEIGAIVGGAHAVGPLVSLTGDSAGGLALVPDGLPGAGRLKVLSWPSGRWSDAGLVVGANGPALSQQRQVTMLSGGPDGFALAGVGGPFAAPHALVAEWSAHAIAAYELDANGDPVPSTRRLVASGCRGALGLAVDPRTGDVLVSTWRGDGTETLAVLRRIDR